MKLNNYMLLTKVLNIYNYISGTILNPKKYFQFDTKVKLKKLINFIKYL